MSEQALHWSKAASSYEEEFVDPYPEDVRSPPEQTLAALARRNRVAADLGCGIGPLLPFLARHFRRVHAVDFAEAMLTRARERVADANNVIFHQRSFADLSPLAGRIDVAVAVNSLVQP